MITLTSTRGAVAQQTPRLPIYDPTGTACRTMSRLLPYAEHLRVVSFTCLPGCLLGPAAHTHGDSGFFRDARAAHCTWRNNNRHHPASVRSLLAGPLFISEPYPYYRVLSAQTCACCRARILSKTTSISNSIPHVASTRGGAQGRAGAHAPRGCAALHPRPVASRQVPQLRWWPFCVGHGCVTPRSAHMH